MGKCLVRKFSNVCAQRIKVGRMERAEYLGVGSEAKRKYAEGLRC